MALILRRAVGVQRTAHRQSAAVEDVGVDHRRLNLFVPQQILNGSDVVPVFEHVGREGVPEGVGRDVLAEIGQVGGQLNRLAQTAGGDVMAAAVATARVG